MTRQAQPPADLRRTVRVCWLVFALFVVYGTTIPFQFSPAPDAVRSRVARLRWDPLISPESGRRLSIPDVVQNVLLFVPFGLLGVLGTTGRASAASGRRVAAVTGLGFGLSCGVEALQLLTADRISSIGDVGANTVGAFVGAATGTLLVGSLRRAEPWLRVQGLWASWAAQAVTLGLAMVVISAWEPFDPTLDVGAFAAKIRMLLADPWQAGVPRDEGVALVQCALFGAAAAAWLAGRSRRQPARTAALVTGVVVAALEGSQLLMASRMPGLADALVRIAGAGAGAALWSAARERAWIGRHWPGVAVAALSAGAAVQTLSPFDWRGAPAAMQWFPFIDYYARTSLQTVSHVFELGLTYSPVGFVLGWDGRRRHGLAAALAVAFGVSGLLECAQLWVNGRYGDVTDVGVAVAAAWAGYRLGSWIRPENRD